MQRLIYSITTIIGFVLIMSWLQNIHPIFDALTHFRLHIMGILACLTLIFLLIQHYKTTTVLLAILTISTGLTFPFLPFLTPPHHNNTGPNSDFTVVQFNLRFDNQDIEKAIKSLLEVQTDVYIFQELVAKTRPIFNAVQQSHPFTLECTTPTIGSVAIASRYPFSTHKKSICLRRKGFLAAPLFVNGRTITVANLHTKWPWPFNQHRQITQLEQKLKNLHSPLILAGDFNAAPWANLTRRVGHYTKTKIVPGVIFSWRPTMLAKGEKMPLLLPLDHILYSKELTPLARRTLNYGGSDHLPIITHFKIKG